MRRRMRVRASASQAKPHTTMLAAPISTRDSCAGLTSWRLKQLRVRSLRRACRRRSGVLILKLEMLKDLDQPILDAEANWKALVERGAGYPLRVAEQRGGHGLVSRQLRRASLHGWAEPGVEESNGVSGHAGNLQHAPGSAGEQHRYGGREPGQFGCGRQDHPGEHSGQSMPSWGQGRGGRLRWMMPTSVAVPGRPGTATRLRRSPRDASARP